NTWDVVVIGGGPAGATTAGLLAQQGFCGLVVEKTAFLCFPIWGAMGFGALSVLLKLGGGGALDLSRPQQKVGAMFNLFGQREYLFGLAREVPECVPENRGRYYAWNALRSKFDHLLLEHARNLGAEVVQPATVEQVLFDGFRATGAVLATA